MVHVCRSTQASPQCCLASMCTGITISFISFGWWRSFLNMFCMGSMLWLSNQTKASEGKHRTELVCFERIAFFGQKLMTKLSIYRSPTNVESDLKSLLIPASEVVLKKLQRKLISQFVWEWVPGLNLSQEISFFVVPLHLYNWAMPWQDFNAMTAESPYLPNCYSAWSLSVIQLYSVVIIHLNRTTSTIASDGRLVRQ